jgi:hypothetical protein
MFKLIYNFLFRKNKTQPIDSNSESSDDSIKENSQTVENSKNYSEKKENIKHLIKFNVIQNKVKNLSPLTNTEIKELYLFNKNELINLIFIYNYYTDESKHYE